MAEIKITQAVDLSLTEDLVPVIIHVKQYENGVRTIAASIYQDAVLFDVPDDAEVNLSGTRPDGGVFQYSSEEDSDVVWVSDGIVYFVITEYMTAAAGKVPVDVTLIDGDGGAIGTFSCILKVARAALENQGLTTGSYFSVTTVIAEGIASCYINEDGYLCIESDDGLTLTFTMDDEGNITVEYGG